MFFAVHPWAPDVERGVVLRGDAVGYHGLAKSILGDSRFAIDEDSPPSAIRTPIFPAYIALIYFLFGEHPWVVLLTNTLLDCVSCVLLISVARQMVGEKAAIAAACFYAIDPFLISLSCTLLSDTLFVFLLVLGMSFVGRLKNENQGLAKSAAIVAMVSAIWGVAALTRPIAQFTPLLLVPFWFLVSKPRRAVLLSSISLAVFVLVLTPWLLRNQNVFNHARLSTSSDYNMLALYIAPMILADKGGNALDVKAGLFREAEKKMEQDGFKPESLNEMDRCVYYRAIAIKYISENPLAFTKTYIRGLAHTMLSLGTSFVATQLGIEAERINIKLYTSPAHLVSDFIENKGFAMIVIGGVLALFLAVSYACAGFGVFLIWGDCNRPLVLLALSIALYFLILTGSGGLSRFRLPMIPFYAPFCGVGATWLLRWCASRSFMHRH